MSSQVRQPCQALELHLRAGLRSLGVPTSAQPPSKSFAWGPEWWLDFGCGFLGDFLGNARFCGLAPSAKNPQKSAHPVVKSAPKSTPKSAPKIRPKIRTKIRIQNPHQNPHPKSATKSAPKLSTNTHRDPQRKGHKGCP